MLLKVCKGENTMTIEQHKQNFDLLQALNLLVSERYYLSKKMDLNEIANKGFQTIMLDNCTYDFDLVMEDGFIKVEKQNLETDKYRHLVGFFRIV